MTKADKEGQRKAPILRFKSFTDDWEQRKIKDYVNYRRGSFPQPYGKKEWYGGNDSMPFVQVVDVKENLHLADHTKQRISKLAQPKSVFVPAGEVLVTVQGSIGKVAITQYPSYIDRTLIVFEKYNTRTDKYFWAYTLQRKFEIEKRKAPGGTIKTITKKALSDFSIPITNYEEQGYLGTFFLKVDKLLTLYERKLKLLSQVKKYFLDNLFAEKEYPNLRFKGFTDAWEQRKLGGISYIKGRIGWKSLKQSEYVEKGPALIASKHISNGKINWTSVDHIPDWRYEESPEIMLELNDIIFSKDGSIGNPAVITLLPNKATINSTMMLVRLDKNILSAGFFYQILVSNQFKKLVFEKTSGSSIPHIFQNDMKKFKFYFPQQGEQIKISNMLNILDNLIALYENKQQHLTKIKKTLLNTMFI